MHRHLLAASLFFAASSCAAQSTQDVLNAVAADPLLKTLGVRALTQENPGFSATVGTEKVFFFLGSGRAVNAAFLRKGQGLPNGMKLSEGVFIAASAPNTVAASDIPTAMRPTMAAYASGDLALLSGVNLFAKLDAAGSSSASVAVLRDILGAKDGVLLTGALAKEALDGLLGKGGVTPDFSLTAKVPSFTPRGLSGAVAGRGLEASFTRSGGAESLAGRFDLTFTLPKEMGGTSFPFGGSWSVSALGQPTQTATFATDDASRVSFKNAFGLSWVDLEGVGLSLTVQGRESDVALDGTLDTKKVLVQFSEEAGKLKDFTLEMPDSLRLGELPGLKDIPGAAEFTLTDPLLCRDAVFAKTSFKGEVADGLVFKDGAGGWNLGLKLETAMNLGSLVGQNHGLLKQIELPQLDFILSTKGFQGDFASLPPAVSRFFTQPGGSAPSGPVAVVKGINARAQFDPAKGSPSLSKQLAALGLSQPVTISGALEGVFGGPVAVDLAATLPEGHSTAFKFLKPRPGTASKFFVRLTEGEADIGVGGTVDLPGGKGQPPVGFETDFKLKLMEEEVEVAVQGSLLGVWKNAVGIPGFSLENPSLSVGVNETGGFDMLVDGMYLFGSEKVRVSADLVIEPEAGFVPESVAFAGKINKIDFDRLSSVGEGFARASHGRGLAGGGFHGLPVELTDVAFAVMSPGASLPPDLASELHMVGQGVALKGKLWVAKRQMADASGFVSGEGLGITGDITPFKVGPLDLRDAKLDVQANLDTLPRFLMKGDIELLKGDRERYDFEVMADRFRLMTETKMGGLFDLMLDAETTQGLALTPANDLDFEAALSADYAAKFKALMQGTVKGLQKGAADIASAQGKVNDAQAKVDGLNRQIAAAKARAEAAAKKAAQDIGSAQAKVNSLKGEIDSKNGKIHDLSDDRKKDLKKLKVADAAKKEAEIVGLTTEVGGLYTAYGTAKSALEAAQKAAKGYPADASPQVLGLEAELGTETAGLKAAQGVLAAAQAADKGLRAAAKALEQGDAVFQVNKMTAAGSLDGLVTAGLRGKAPLLKVYCTVAGAHHLYTVNIAQGEKDFARLAQRLADEAARDLVTAVTKG